MSRRLCRLHRNCTGSPHTGDPLALGIQLWLHSRAGGSGSWAALLGADVMRGKEMIDIPSPLATASSRSLYTQVTFSRPCRLLCLASVWSFHEIPLALTHVWLTFPLFLSLPSGCCESPAVLKTPPFPFFFSLPFFLFFLYIYLFSTVILNL